MTLRKDGFTLIELLVVIAIIGILSAVVLGSLNSARTKGSDASIRQNLSGTRAQAELFYYANANSYSGVCGAAPVGGVKSINAQVVAAANASGLGSIAINAVGTNSTATCNATATGWAAEIPLRSAPGMYCVDSTGNASSTPASTLTTTTDVSC